jgi:hypothetical protein
MAILKYSPLFLILSLFSAGTVRSDEQAKTGIVKIDSEPEGATVMVEGKTFGPTPVLIELPVGKHEILVTKDGHFSATRSIQVRRDTLARSSFKLEASVTKGIRVHRTGEGEPDAGPATVTISTSPPGFSVLMNDLLVPQPTPVAFDVQAGIYELTLEEKGEVVYRKTVFARAGRTLELDLVVKRKRTIDDSDPWTD